VVLERHECAVYDFVVVGPEATLTTAARLMVKHHHIKRLSSDQHRRNSCRKPVEYAGRRVLSSRNRQHSIDKASERESLRPTTSFIVG
jgi:hypothetical protein